MEFFVDDFNAMLEVTVFDSDLFSPNGSFVFIIVRKTVLMINFFLRFSG